MYVETKGLFPLRLRFALRGSYLTIARHAMPRNATRTRSLMEIGPDSNTTCATHSWPTHVFTYTCYEW